MENDAKKFILDPTAGYRVMWGHKKHPNCIYLDPNPECEPDVIGSYTDLSMFPPKKFKLIVYDPPHMLYYCKNPSFLKDKYSILERETWQEDLRKAFNEMWRVLDDYGVLVFKWNDNHIKSKKVLGLFPVEPLFGQTVGGSRGVRDNKKCEKCQVCVFPCPKGNGPRSQTYYYVFMKIPKEETNDL